MLLIALAVVAGSLWYLENQEKFWHEAPGYVIAVQPVAMAEDEGQAAEVGVAYQYAVGGETYAGDWSGKPKRANTLVAGTGRDYDAAFAMAAVLVDFDMLPDQAKEFLRTKGINDSEAVVEKTYEFLNGKRDISLSDFPEDVIVALRGDLPVSGEVPALKANPSRSTSAAAPVVPVSGTGLRTFASTDTSRTSPALRVMYDPKDPSRSRIRRPGRDFHLPHAVFSLVSFGFAVGYFTLVYPVWKRIQ